MKATLVSSSLARGAKASLLVLSLIGAGFIAAAQSAVPVRSPTELLEQGVYSEETKGDVDAAIRLYQQVVESSKASEASAAEAQYRLGVCYYKKKDFAKATAAFEKVIKDHSDQKELVARASEYLAGAVALLPVPWTDGEEMQLDIKTRTGFKVGFVRYDIHSGTLNGQRIWRIGSRLVAGAQQASLAEVETDSFKPIHSRWRHTVLGDADTVYSAGRATIRLESETDPKTIELGGICYDNEQGVQLFRRLPLAKGYSTTVRFLTSLGGTIIPIRIEVLDVEDVEVPAGKFSCYKVKLGTVNQTFWYSADEHRYLVKFDAGAIVAELTGVTQLKAGEGTDADAFNFPLGEAGGGVPTIQDQASQRPQNQAKILVLATAKLGHVPLASNWCEMLNATHSGMPGVPTNTVFALNAKVAGRKLANLPSDTVVFFETKTHGWNQAGGPEMLAKKPSGVAVAFADGRALLVDPAETARLRWEP